MALARYREALQREAEANRRNDRRANDAAAAGGGSIAADILWREREEAILRAALKDHLLCGFTKVRGALLVVPVVDFKMFRGIFIFVRLIPFVNSLFRA